MAQSTKILIDLNSPPNPAQSGNKLNDLIEMFNLDVNDLGKPGLAFIDLGSLSPDQITNVIAQLHKADFELMLLKD